MKTLHADATDMALASNVPNTGATLHSPVGRGVGTKKKKILMIVLFFVLNGGAFLVCVFQPYCLERYREFDCTAILNKP